MIYQTLPVGRETPTNTQDAQFTLVIPGTYVRALYATATDVPHFDYWIDVYDGNACGDPYTCPTSTYRSPVSGTWQVTVVHHFSLRLLKKDGSTPLQGMPWKLSYYSASDNATPVTITTGTTGADGWISLDMPITTGMLDSAALTGGYLNFFVAGWCLTNVYNVCVPLTTTQDRATSGEDEYALLYNTAMNLANGAYDAAIAGIAAVQQAANRQFVVTLYDPNGTFHPQAASCDSDQSCNTGSSTSSGACSADGYYLAESVDKWSGIAEGHADYGGQANYHYGEQSDSTWTVGFLPGSGPGGWRISGNEQIAGKSTWSQETSYGPHVTSGSGNTRIRFAARVKYGRYVSRATRYDKDGNPFCDEAGWIHNLGRVFKTYDDSGNATSWKLGNLAEDKGSGIATATSPGDFATANTRMKDRCWSTCTASPHLKAFVPNQWSWESSVNTGKKGKSEYVSYGLSLWAFSGGYSSGHSSSAWNSWHVGQIIAGCGNGWKIYYDGTLDPTDPNDAAGNAFMDAGDEGAAYTTVNGRDIPVGC